MIPNRFAPAAVAGTARNPGGQSRRKLHRIQVTPTPVSRVIFHRTGRTTLRARHTSADELQRQCQRSVPHIKVHMGDGPVRIQPHQLMIMTRQRVHRFDSQRQRSSHFQIPSVSVPCLEDLRRTSLPGDYGREQDPTIAVSPARCQ
jgi:hypothetical protein